MDAVVSTKSTFVGGKESHRRQLADLPYPEKVRIVVELQKIAAPILKARGLTVVPWRLNDMPQTAHVGRTGRPPVRQ